VGDAASCYGAFRESGFRYGPSFQTIQELRINGTAALAKLRLPDHLKPDYGEFILHPSMIDGALQTIAGVAASRSPSTLFVPFAVDEIEILKPVPHNCYAYAEQVGSQSADVGLKFDVRLLNESGDVLMRFRNLHVRPLTRPRTQSVA
jgi:hypothetical protein